MFDNKKIVGLEERIRGITQLLWLATQRTGGNMQFTNDELDEVPQGAQLKFHNIDGGLEVISTTDLNLNGAAKSD